MVLNCISFIKNFVVINVLKKEGIRKYNLDNVLVLFFNVCISFGFVDRIRWVYGGYSLYESKVVDMFWWI